MGEERNNKSSTPIEIISPPTNISGEEIYNNNEELKEYIERTKSCVICFRVNLKVKHKYDNLPLRVKRNIQEFLRNDLYAVLFGKKPIPKILKETHRVLEIKVKPDIQNIVDLIYKGLMERMNEDIVKASKKIREKKSELKEMEMRIEEYKRYENYFQELIKEIISMEMFVNDESYSEEQRIDYIRAKISKIKEKYSKFI